MTTLDDVDRSFLEGIFGTNPEVENLRIFKDVLDEWIVELEADKNE